MRRRRGSEGPRGDEGSWLNTYADMVTLLLTFFILMFSMSSINVEKWEEMNETTQASSTPSAVGITKEEVIEEAEVVKPTDFDELYRHLRDYIKDNDMDDSMSVYRGPDYVFMRFKSNIFFGPDSAVLKYEARDVLDKLCDAIVGINDEIGMLRVTGHTADIVSNSKYPISDRVLSTERANNVVEFIEDRNVISPTKLISIGYGKHYPIGDNSTLEGQAQNRRVEIYISEVDTDRAEVAKLYSEIADADLKGAGEVAAKGDAATAEARDNQRVQDELSSAEVDNLDKA